MSFAQVLKEAPENAAALNALAWVHRKAKRSELAAEHFQRVLALQPTNLGALHALGMIAREKGDHESSLQHFRRAKQQSPQTLYVRLEVGHCLQHLQRFDEAAAEFEEILKEWP